MQTFKRILTSLLLLCGFAHGQALFNFGGDSISRTISNIDDFHDVGAGTICSSVKQTTTPPDWSYNCDTGSGTSNGGICTSSAGVICGNSVFNATTQLDGKSREMDFSWSCPAGGCINTSPGCVGTTCYGGYNFHVDENAGATLDGNSTGFTWTGHFYYTDMTHINQVELDFYQTPTGASSEVLIFAAQCNFNDATGSPTGSWEFANGWPSPMHSNIGCPKAQWSINTWHTVSIKAHRCATFVSGSACNITYDGVTFDSGGFVPCTVGVSSPCIHDGRTAQAFNPTGLWLQNVQLDMSFTGSGSMTEYADEMTVTATP